MPTKKHSNTVPARQVKKQHRSVAQPQRSLAAVQSVAELSDRIYALAKMLELADELAPDTNKLDPQAVGHIGRMIAIDISRINSVIDEKLVSVREKDTSRRS